MLPHAIRFADTPFPSLLRHGKQGIKVSLLFHQFVKGSGFGNTAVLQNQYPVIPAQKRFLQSVSHNDPGHSGKIQQIGSPQDIYNEPKNVFVAKFIGESNILPGIMKKDLLVNFMGRDFECVDSGFMKNEPVDVVVRPEDIDMVSDADADAHLHGKVKSVLFMGVHYEFRVECGDVMLTVHSTDYVEPGCEVGVVILPDAIHIMHKSDAPDAAEPLPQEDLPEDTPELLPEE